MYFQRDDDHDQFGRVREAHIRLVLENSNEGAVIAAALYWGDRELAAWCWDAATRLIGEPHLPNQVAQESRRVTDEQARKISNGVRRYATSSLQHICEQSRLLYAGAEGLLPEFGEYIGPADTTGEDAAVLAVALFADDWSLAQWLWERGQILRTAKTDEVAREVAAKQITPDQREKMIDALRRTGIMAINFFDCCSPGAIRPS